MTDRLADRLAGWLARRLGVCRCGNYYRGRGETRRESYFKSAQFSLVGDPIFARHARATAPQTDLPM